VNLVRFEAGTPAIGEAIGFGAAVDYLSSIGMDRIHEYEVLVFQSSTSFKMNATLLSKMRNLEPFFFFHANFFVQVQVILIDTKSNNFDVVETV